jgi:hypothetical protein
MRNAEHPTPVDEFVSEPIRPLGESFLTSSMAAGEPGLPMRFQWRKADYEVIRILEKWTSTGPCHHGSGEQYVRRHWFRIETADGSVMLIYFERQARRGQDVKKRWWLATVSRS